MKRILAIILCLTAFMNANAQTPRYLINNCKTENENYFHFHKSTHRYKKMEMGGIYWSNGFTLGSFGGFLIAPEDVGSVVFKLNDSYEKLTFFMGAPDTDDSVIGSSPNHRAGVPGVVAVSIHADGKKVFDQLVRNYDVGKRYTVNINGAKELKFKIHRPNGDELVVGFAEAALWKAGETPYETGNIITDKPTKKQLVKDIWPYALSGGHGLATPKEFGPAGYSTVKSIPMGNRRYESGIIFDMTVPLIGNNPHNSFFNLRGQYETLTFLAGPVNSDNAKNKGRGWITIKGDGKILYEYEVRQDELPKQFTIDVTGVHQLCFLSEQATESMNGCVVDAWVYPKGEKPATLAQAGEDGAVMELAAADPKLKAMPDVCKLISSLPPYSCRSSAKHQVFDGSSDYITFSMGGIRYNEGVILYREPNFWDDDPTSYAAWDLGGEFDYLSFTVGFVGKSWSMTDDYIMVYADDQLIAGIPTYATMMNKHVTIPLNKCRKLRIENRGGGKMDNGAYGVADLVVYRGEPVENDLFYHPKPECPYNIDLIDLGKPYVHYVAGYENSQDQIFHDGTSKRSYVTTYSGERIYKCFVLQTSVHFSLDFGPLADKGTEGAASVMAGMAAVGASFIPIASVGGAMVGATFAGLAGALLLAAGGEACENSCAAFNTWGEYNSLTFTVACLRTQGDTQLLGPDNYSDNEGYKEHLLIGSNQEVIAELTVYEGMQPQTITVPIEGCQQLMFWLANTHNTSAAYVFYDLKLSKDKCTLDIPDAAKLSKPHFTETSWSAVAPPEWDGFKSSGAKELDNHLSQFSRTHRSITEYVKKYAPEYDIVTYYLNTNSGDVVKAVKLRKKGLKDMVDAGPGRGGHYDIFDEIRSLERQIAKLQELQSDLMSLTISQANAALDLPSLGLGAVAYGKLVKQSSAMLKPMKTAVSTMLDECKQLYSYLRTVADSALDIDGNKSREDCILCPLFKGEQVPDEDRMLVENFNLW